MRLVNTGTGSETIPTCSISPDPSDSEVNVCRLGFSSSHRFYMGFRSGYCDDHGKTFILQSVNHFCVDFEVCFGSLSCWKVQPRPILSLLEVAVRFSCNICWYLMVHDTMYPNKMSRAFGRKTAPQHQRSATILHIGYEVLFCMAIFLSTPDPPLMFVAKKLHFGHI